MRIVDSYKFAGFHDVEKRRNHPEREHCGHVQLDHHLQPRRAVHEPYHLKQGERHHQRHVRNGNYNQHADHYSQLCETQRELRHQQSQTQDQQNKSECKTQRFLSEDVVHYFAEAPAP